MIDRWELVNIHSRPGQATPIRYKASPLWWWWRVGGRVGGSGGVGGGWCLVGVGRAGRWSTGISNNKLTQSA